VERLILLCIIREELMRVDDERALQRDREPQTRSWKYVVGENNSQGNITITD